MDQNIAAVNRTLLCVPVIKLLLVVDTMRTKIRPVIFKARWFVENEDKQGGIEFDGARFLFQRPKARLAGGLCGGFGGPAHPRFLSSAGGARSFPLSGCCRRGCR